MVQHPWGGVNSAWLGSKIFQEGSTPPMGWLDKLLLFGELIMRLCVYPSDMHLSDKKMKAVIVPFARLDLPSIAGRL